MLANGQSWFLMFTKRIFIRMEFYLYKIANWKTWPSASLFGLIFWAVYTILTCMVWYRQNENFSEEVKCIYFGACTDKNSTTPKMLLRCSFSILKIHMVWKNHGLFWSSVYARYANIVLILCSTFLNRIRLQTAADWTLESFASRSRTFH